MATTRTVSMPIGGVDLQADIAEAEPERGLVVFVHGSGSSRHSRRNQYVAEQMQSAGLSTVLVDLLTLEEEHVDARTAEFRFNIEFLAQRVVGVIDEVVARELEANHNIGIFGASTGAAAALVAAARRPESVKAIVSRGGRPDLVGDLLVQVRQPTLLIVGGNDPVVLERNRAAMSPLSGDVRLEIIRGASHLFQEPGALELVAQLARDWFTRHLRPSVPTVGG